MKNKNNIKRDRKHEKSSDRNIYIMLLKVKESYTLLI